MCHYEPPNFTLNLRLVHHKVLVVPTALKLFPVAVVETQCLILQLMKREERSRESAVTSISSQDGKRFLLKHSYHYTLKTHLYMHWLHDAWLHTSPHPLCAHVDTLVHRHVLDDCTEWKRQSHIVWPVETPLENGTAICNRHNKSECYSQTGLKNYILQFYCYWTQLPSSWPLSIDPW